MAHNANQIREAIAYDPETGIFVWKVRPTTHFKDATSARKWNNRHAGKLAGGIDSAGYRCIVIFGAHWGAHRLLWFLEHGDLPEQIDHINGNRSDNRLSNLRAVTNLQNAQNQKLHKNNSSGFIGVHHVREGDKWRARIVARGVIYNLGTFTDFESAVAARIAAHERFGFHPNHGAPSKVTYAKR